MKKEFIGLIIVVALVLTAVSSFILYNHWPLLTGDKVILATKPIDPFDPFRGQYITINYEISTISDIDGFKEGDAIYISLKEDEQGIWQIEDISKSKPRVGEFIRGKVINVNGDSVRVEYGIEQFFFENNAQFPTRNITVEVSLASSGRAKIYQVLHNGKPVEIGYKTFSIKS